MAKLAGVSTATVSLALRNSPRIGIKVRRRIHRIAAKAGYQVNPIVANLLAQLRSKKEKAYQSTLGLVSVGNRHSDLKQYETVQEWISGCTERASFLGYKMDCFSLVKGETTVERLSNILISRDIRGLLIIGSDIGYVVHRQLDLLLHSSAAVVIGVQPIYPQLSFTSNEQFSTTATAMNELLKLGYKRPGLCIWPKIDEWVRKRFSGGYYVGLDKVLKRNRIPRFDFEYGEEKRFTKWLRQYRPDVILTLHPEIVDWIKASNLEIPRDIGIAHLDWHPGMQLAGMLQNNKDVGRAAVDILIAQLHRNEFGVPPLQKAMYVTASWVPGASVRVQDDQEIANKGSTAFTLP